MKILQIHKYFYLRGGASRYFFEVSRLLQKNGHKIAYFSTKSPFNEKSKWSKYFIHTYSFEKISINNALNMFLQMLYSFEARRNISLLLDEFKPDVVHLHSIYHQISPSIILEIKKRGIPIVQTLHDYHVVAPNHTLFHNGKVCEITKKNAYFKAIFHKCIKNSYWASIAETIEQYLHQFLKIYTNNVDIFITPSTFFAKKLEEYGMRGKKIHILNNFCDSSLYVPQYKRGDYVLYFGRLSPEKGLLFLISVAAKMPYVPFKIVGEGPQKSELKRCVEMKGIKNIEFIEHKIGDELKNYISNSRFVILPSECFEIFPMSILESFALGKAVVASNIGGIPELVTNEQNGYLFNVGDSLTCVKYIDRLWKDPQLCLNFGKSARYNLETYFDKDIHLNKLRYIFGLILNQKKID